MRWKKEREKKNIQRKIEIKIEIQVKLEKHHKSQTEKGKVKTKSTNQ